MAALLACGCLGSVTLLHSAIPALSRWEAPYGIEGRESPSESVTMEKILPEQGGEYRLREVIEPLPPMMLDLAGRSRQGNYTDGIQVVHLIAVQVKSLEEAQSLVAQVDEEVERAGAVSLNSEWEIMGRWRGFASRSGAWKMSRLAWDKWYVRFHIPTWDGQGYGLAWNNGSWVFIITGDSKRALERFVPHFDY